MPTIQGVQINTTDQWAKTDRAQKVVGAMVTLLRERKYGMVGRTTFLRRWGKLRTALRLSPEYAELRWVVIARCGGKCEVCRKRAVAHIHHVKHVAWYPHLALRPDNCLGVCEKCHKSAHRSAARQGSRGSSGSLVRAEPRGAVQC